MARRAFVTGATGFLGLNLVEVLVGQGWEVLALHRSESDVGILERLGVRLVQGDITDARGLRQAMPLGVDAVFHLAGDTSLWARQHAAQSRVNIRGTRNVVRAALATGAGRLVHVSSIVAYGMHGGVITEETPTRGTTSPIKYVRSKALAEREIHKGISRGLTAVIVNPSNMMGRYDLSNWARLFRLVAARRILSVPAGGGSFCHGASVARALVVAAERGQAGQNYLLGGADTSYSSLVRAIGTRLQRRVPLLRLPLSVLRTYASMEEWIAPIFRRSPEITRDAVELLAQNFYCSSRRAIAELAYEPAPLEIMLDETQRWLEECGLLRAPRRR